MTELTGDEAPCAHLCYCARPGLLAEIASLRGVVDELRSMETIERLEAEIDRLRADYNAMRRLALDCDETNARLRAALKGIAEYCSADGSPLGAIARLTDIRNTADQVLAHEQREGTCPRCGGRGTIYHGRETCPVCADKQRGKEQ